MSTYTGSYSLFLNSGSRGVAKAPPQSPLYQFVVDLSCEHPTQIKIHERKQAINASFEALVSRVAASGCPQNEDFEVLGELFGICHQMSRAVQEFSGIQSKIDACRQWMRMLLFVSTHAKACSLERARQPDGYQSLLASTIDGLRLYARARITEPVWQDKIADECLRFLQMSWSACAHYFPEYSHSLQSWMIQAVKGWPEQEIQNFVSNPSALPVELDPAIELPIDAAPFFDDYFRLIQEHERLVEELGKSQEKMEEGHFSSSLQTYRKTIAGLEQAIALYRRYMSEIRRPALKEEINRIVRKDLLWTWRACESFWNEFSRAFHAEESDAVAYLQEGEVDEIPKSRFILAYLQKLTDPIQCADGLQMASSSAPGDDTVESLIQTISRSVEEQRLAIANAPDLEKAKASLTVVYREQRGSLPVSDQDLFLFAIDRLDQSGLKERDRVQSQDMPDWKKRIIGTCLLGLQASCGIDCKREAEHIQALAAQLQPHNTLLKDAEREAGFLSKTLIDHLDHLRDMTDEQFNEWTQRYPTTRAVLQQARSKQILASHSSFAVDKKPLQREVAQLEEKFLQTPQRSWWQTFTTSLFRMPMMFAEAIEVPSDSDQKVWTAVQGNQTLVPYLAQDTCTPLKEMERCLEANMAKIRPAFVQTEEMGGTKYRGLMMMDRLVHAVQAPYPVIPAPRCLSHEWVLDHLQKHSPAVFEHWEALGKLFAAAPDGFLDNPQILERLSAIDHAIEEAFRQADLPRPLIRWLEQIKAEGRTLAVRSSGHEDGKTPNAGGHTSKVYVSAAPEELCPAAGEVIRSYFSVRALQNRLNAKDNIFESPLSLAVAIQPMVAEPIGQNAPEEIPTAFVLFTNEPLYVGTERFRVTTLSATFGHGEAVVGNQGIATDTILILQSESHPDQLYVLYANERKEYRLAPVKETDGVHLKKVKNPEEMQSRHSLTEQQIREIVLSGLLVEAAWPDEGAIDIEGVVQNGRVHFVQARPVIRKPMLPTYIDSDIPRAAIIDSLEGETLVSGKASAIVIDQKNDVLLASSLEEAERHYSGQKLVVVTHPEPKNSHPTVNFSTLGVPCLYIPSQNLQQMFDSINSARPLAVCVQKGKLYLLDRAAAHIEEHIKSGFAVHPAKIAVSLPIERFYGVVSAPVPEEMKTLFSELRDAHDPETARGLITKIERHPLMRQLESAVCRPEHMPQPIQSRIEAMALLYEAIKTELAELKAAIHGSAGRLEYLFHVKALQTLMLGSSDLRHTGRYSLLDIASLDTQIEIMAAYQKELAAPAQCMAPAQCLDILMQGHLHNAESFQEWRTFLLSIEPLIQSKQIWPDELQHFKNKIAMLQKTNTLPIWMAMGRWLSDETPIKRFRSILDEITIHDTELNHILQKVQDDAQAILTSMDRFGDPKQIAAAQKELTALIKQCSNPAWLEKIRDASQIERLIAYSLLDQVADLMDQSIKTLQASSAFSRSEEQVEHYRTMINLFYDLMVNWAKHLVPDGIIPNHRDYLIELFKHFFHTTESNDPSQMEPSAGFSVSAAMIGSQTALNRHQPRTLEDMFTLCHQNAVYCLNVMRNDLFEVQQSLLPPLMKQAAVAIEQFPWRYSVQRSGLEIRDQSIVITYNIPIQNHASRIELHYDLISQKLIFKGQMIGEARTRWGDLARLARLLTASQIFHEVSEYSLKNDDQEMTFYWGLDVNNLEAAQIAFKHILICSDYYVTFSQLLSDLIVSFKIISGPHARKLQEYVRRHPTNYADCSSCLQDDAMVEEAFEKIESYIFENDSIDDCMAWASACGMLLDSKWVLITSRTTKPPFTSRLSLKVYEHALKVYPSDEERVALGQQIAQALERKANDWIHDSGDYRRYVLRLLKRLLPSNYAVDTAVSFFQSKRMISSVQSRMEIMFMEELLEAIINHDYIPDDKKKTIFQAFIDAIKKNNLVLKYIICGVIRNINPHQRKRSSEQLNEINRLIQLDPC